MEVCRSELPKKAYMAQLHSCFSFPLAMYKERVTGIIIGRFFSVAYYAPYEWNHRITNECSRAIGYAKETDGKTELRFVRSKGLMSPFWLIFCALFCAAMFAISGEKLTPFLWIISAVISVFVCGLTAVQDSLTETGQEGDCIITSLLEKPEEFYYC